MAKIGLIDVDGHNYPNLPLMKLSAYHKAHGNEVEWYDPWSGILESYEEVHMSKVFSFTPDYNIPIYAKTVYRGGTGYAIKKENGIEVFHRELDPSLPSEIEHIYPDYSLYPDLTKDTAYGFLTRGCPRGCGFCHVAPKEGRRSYKVADLDEFWKGQSNIVLNDPNILGYPGHKGLLQQLADSKATVEFNQGLDIRFVTDDNIDFFRQIDFKTIHFAFDRYEDWNEVVPKLKMFKEATGYNKNKGQVLVYILVNYNSTLEQDLERIELCRELKFAPFVMIYDKAHCDPIYRKLQRWANNYFVFWKVKNFKEYNA